MRQEEFIERIHKILEEGLPLAGVMFDEMSFEDIGRVASEIQNVYAEAAQDIKVMYAVKEK